MRQNFEETRIPEDVSKELMESSLTIGSLYIGKVLKTIVYGVSNLLSDVRDKNQAKAVAFRKIDGTFIAGAKLEYISNPESSNPADGSWSYTWTFYEKDLEGATITDISTNIVVYSYFTTVADKLFKMRFNQDSGTIRMFNIIFENISHWLDDNVKEDEVQTLVLEDTIEASCEVVDGIVVKSLVPSAEAKKLIKSDDAIQDNGTAEA